MNGMHTKLHETFWTAFCCQEIVSILFCFCLKQTKTAWVSVIIRGAFLARKGMPSRIGGNCTHFLPDSATEGEHLKESKISNSLFTYCRYFYSMCFPLIS